MDVPALRLEDRTLIVEGRYLKIASIHDELWIASELGDPAPLISGLRTLDAQHRPDIFSFTQKIPNATPQHDFPFEWDSHAVVPITTYNDWWEQLPRETRKNVRRAEKRGVIVTRHAYDDEMVAGILDIQNECPVRQGRRYPHYGKTFSQVKHDHAGFAESSDFLCAYSENELIGFLKLVWRENIASIMQLSAKVAHFDKRPSNLLLARAIALCAQRGVSHLTYGKFNYGKKDDCGLREFKTRNGFGNFLVPKYYVPLTPWGRLCVRARLYRNLHQILPAAAIRAAVNVRSFWYERVAHLQEPGAELAQPARPSLPARSKNTQLTESAHRL